MDFVGIIDDMPVYANPCCPQAEMFLVDGSMAWSSNTEYIDRIPKAEFCLINPEDADNDEFITNGIIALKLKRLEKGNGNGDTI
jgi:hypothetical protein